MQPRDLSYQIPSKQNQADALVFCSPLSSDNQNNKQVGQSAISRDLRGCGLCNDAWQAVLGNNTKYRFQYLCQTNPSSVQAAFQNQLSWHLSTIRPAQDSSRHHDQT